MLKDYFSDNSAQYSQYRPRYPQELFAYLASVSPNKNKAWDCGCGTGQAAVGLSEYFKTVVATDGSENQIRKAVAKPTITYHVSPAESSPLANNEVDLITVAQAMHWFEIASFFKEADRVLKQDGILAVWTYNLLRINEKLDAIINALYHQVLNPYWPPERKMVEDGYSGINFPFTALAPPSFAMHEEWDLGQLLGYLETWSAIKRYRKENAGQDALAAFFAQIRSAWGSAEAKQTVTWPLKIIVRKKSSEHTPGMQRDVA